MDSQQPQLPTETPIDPAAEATPEQLRREFLKRFGSYAAGSAVGLYVLMSPKTAKAAGIGSDGG